MSKDDGLGKPSLMTKDDRFSPLVIALAHADPKASLVVRSVLDCLGCRSILLVRDGTELLARSRAEPVDLAVVDWTLRTECSVDVITRLRRDVRHPRRDLPVILLSPDKRHETVAAARDAGANELVAKPFTAKQLLASVFSLIERPRPFVIAPGYVGPDRRSPSSFSTLLPARRPQADLRRQHPVRLQAMQAAAGLDDGVPALVAPDFRLKAKVGLASPEPFQPPAELISRVEASLSSARVSLAGDIEAEVGQLLVLNRLLIQRPDRVAQTVAAIKQSAGWIEVRAVDLGYVRIPEVARLLLDFCDKYFLPGNPSSLLLLEKHALALMAILSAGPEAARGATGESLVRDLARQVAAFRASEPDNRR